MTVEKSNDDVIRIRVDTALAVQDFLDLLAAQAAEGETRAPANPANRALFRELAPYRLVEYAYVDEAVGEVDGAYLGFPDGSIYAVADEIPEAVVDAVVQGAVAEMAPVYLYIVPAQPRGAAVIDRFLKALSIHLGKPLVGVFRDQDGALAAHGYDGERELAASPQRARIEAAMARSAAETARHLSRRQVVEGYAARSQGADGRAWAQVTYDFTKHVIEFASAADRDDFIEWSRALCGWIAAGGCTWAELGFSEVLQPAEVAPAPKGEIVAVPLQSPAQADGGKARQAFPATGASPQALTLVRDYWGYCVRTIAAAEQAAREADAAYL